MSFHNEFDFEGEMIKNYDFYILGHSSQNNELIKSKIEQYKKAPEFFNYYSEKNIISLFELLDILEKNYSHIYNQNMKKQFNTKIDKYISDLSNIILLYNLISKNQNIITNALIHTESYLNHFYLENEINKEFQKKLNNYIDNLINMKKRKKKRFTNLLTTDNLFNKSHRNKTNKTPKQSLFYINRKTEEKNITINNNLFNNIKITPNNVMNEDTSINGLTTPKFPRKDYFDDIIIKDIDNTGKNSILKQESIQSYFTLASKKALITNTPSQDINKAKLKKVKFTEEKKNDYLIDIESDNEAKLVYSKSNVVENNIESNSPNNVKKLQKKQMFSSLNLKSDMERKMMKNFLGFINNLYKNKVINNEEKLKLKQLIISKSKKIENIYNKYYENNKEEFIQELKKLII